MLKSNVAFENSPNILRSDSIRTGHIQINSSSQISPDLIEPKRLPIEIIAKKESSRFKFKILDKFSALPEKRKFKILIIFGIVGSIFVTLLILFILFAAGK